MSDVLRPHGRAVPAPGCLRELASGVDALYLSGRADPSDELLDSLAAAQLRAKAADEPVEFDAGDRFLLLPYSWGKYTYCLTNQHGRVGIRAKGQLPEVRVQPVAESLHGLSPAGVVRYYDESLSTLLGQVVWSVSRVDLFVDVQGWELSPSMADRFVARSKKLTTHSDGELCTGFQFGTRRSKAISARLYDKTVDMAVKGSDWILEAWGDRYNRSLPVHRLEFELRRDAIRQFQVSTPAEVLDAVGDIWRYCTRDWLRLAAPTGDETRSRWPTDPDWAHTIQGASLRQNELGLARVKERKRAASLERLIPGLIGYLVSFAVLTRCVGLTDTLRRIPAHAKEYEERTGLTFGERVRARRRQAGFR